jgi:hypothetical protein
MNDVIGKNIIALHTIQQMSESRVKQLNQRGEACPGTVYLVVAIIDGVSDLGFYVLPSLNTWVLMHCAYSIKSPWTYTAP